MLGLPQNYLRTPARPAPAWEDAVVVEAAEEEADPRFLRDIPRDLTFGLVAGPRLTLPEEAVRGREDEAVLAVGDTEETQQFYNYNYNLVPDLYSVLVQ